MNFIVGGYLQESPRRNPKQPWSPQKEGHLQNRQEAMELQEAYWQGQEAPRHAKEGSHPQEHRGREGSLLNTWLIISKLYLFFIQRNKYLRNSRWISSFIFLL